MAILFLALIPLILSSQLAQAATTTQTQNGYTVTVNDTSNSLPSSTLTNQVNLFFQLYPGMAAGYTNAPKTVTIYVDPNTASNSVGASTTWVRLSVQRLQSSPNDSGYLQFALNFMLSSYYSPSGGTTAKTTTKVPVATTTVSMTTFRQLVLDTHNNYRRLLAKGGSVKSAGGSMPPAANMNQLTYSTDLETAAINWAKQCVVGHTPNGNYGQNLCASGGQDDPSSFLTGCAKLWWDEVLKWPGTSNTLFPQGNFQDIGHWTQMAWAEAKQVGCAVQYCPGTGTLLFCNYDTGNVGGGYTVYNTGSSCSQCTSGCNNGLCT